MLTCAVGKCLGLAPLLYGLGHYRIAVARGTHINLTGPEVIRLFFGTGVDFETRAAAERCLECHDLVHEIVPSLEDALRLCRALIGRRPGAGPSPELGARTGPLLLQMLDGPPREVVPGWCPYRLHAADDVVLFSYSDRVAQEKLGFFREQRLSA